MSSHVVVFYVVLCDATLHYITLRAVPACPFLALPCNYIILYDITLYHIILYNIR